jgi:hypothetical protein
VPEKGPATAYRAVLNFRVFHSFFRTNVDFGSGPVIYMQEGCYEVCPSSVKTSPECKFINEQQKRSKGSR